MLRRVSTALAVGLVLVTSTSCGVEELGRDRLLIWHDWPEAEAAILAELLDSYEDLDPGLDLIVEHVPADEIEARFATEVESGFGPDVLIGADAAELSQLVEAGAVHQISSAATERYGFDELDSRSLSAMSVGDAQRGVPLAAFTDVMYFREGVEPPGSLDDVIELAEAGHSVAIPTDFFDSYWGIDAFGGTIFGQRGVLAPDDGFTDWVEWLVEARRRPNIVLDGEYEVLRDLFAAGRIDVFVGGSREVGTFRTVLQETQGAGVASGDTEPDDAETTGAEIDPSTPTLTNVGELTFGLTTLPSGDNEEPGGLLDVEGMIVNQHTDSLPQSLELMAYLTNVPSQGRIARAGVGRIPVNPSVSIDPTISPMEAALVVQQRHADVVPEWFQGHQTELEAAANEVYLQATRGVIEPADAAESLRESFAAQLEAIEVGGEA